MRPTLRLVVLGNSGSGKSTLATTLAERHGLPVLDLDTVVWTGALPPELRPEAAVAADLEAWATARPGWVAEGSYGQCAERLATWANALVWLDPGVETCIAHQRARPWEPHKYADPAEQERRRAFLEEWTRQYPTRDDEYGRAWHERVYRGFDGPKAVVRDPARAVAEAEALLPPA